METRPPRLIERIVERLIPPACREHVLGDLYEQYASPAQYISDFLAILPFIVASQVRRTFRLELLVSQAAALYIAFGGASLAAGPGYLYERAALMPLAIVIATMLLVLLLCDAYADPQDQSSEKARLHAALALTGGYLAQRAAQFLNPEWTLPSWVMLAGGIVSIPMLTMLQNVFRKPRPGAAVPGSGMAPLDELRRRSAEEYRKAWRVNWIWVTAGLLVVFITPNIWAQPGPSAVGSAVFLIVIILLTGLRGKKGFATRDQEYNALSISRDPYRNQLERKRDGLLFWASGGLFALAPGAGPTLILFLIAFPLFMSFVRWMVDGPYPPNANATRVWIAFIAFAILCVAWAFVRSVNLRAAKAMRDELEALDSEEKHR